MFGLLKPCSAMLGPERFSRWMGHYCGQCLAISDHAGQWPRLVTNCDAVALSVLVEAQTPTTEREAGRCALRGMRKQAIPEGPGVDLAAFASVALASAKIDDHRADGDGFAGSRWGRGLSTRASRSLRDHAHRLGERVSIDADDLFTLLNDHDAAERDSRDLLEAVTPSARATAYLFSRTAGWSEEAVDRSALAEAGFQFGMAAHVLDAVEDFAEDAEKGRWNPLAAHDLTPSEGFAAAGGFLDRLRDSLADLHWREGSLVHMMFAHLAPHAMARIDPERPKEHRTRYGTPKGFFEGLCAASFVCCTCQWCWASEFQGPWSGQPREGCCHQCDCSGCGDCCNCCSCCGEDGCCGDCGCDCSC
ncbi:DUF5685 family protein [Salininema proteolyticum]|uniref:DUF5685 family protein n=1 Tax=Salininema proteolyticum TaxID=1607685 RepID=A0ABV8TWA8_9ACTN